ncbi:MAG TPA: hypothetical protein VF135_06740 [Terriglobales bacterium]
MNSLKSMPLTNLTLAVLGFVALVHSIFRFGTGELPEAILAVLLFVAAFTRRKQPVIVAVVGLAALSIVWAVNSGTVGKGVTTTLLSVIGIALFVILGFSRFIVGRTETKLRS